VTQTIILHAVAAVLWFLTIGMAIAFANHDKDGNKKRADLSAILLSILAVAAFTLQVIA